MTPARAAVKKTTRIYFVTLVLSTVLNFFLTVFEESSYSNLYSEKYSP